MSVQHDSERSGESNDEFEQTDGSLSRRGTLTALTGLGLLGLTAGSARAATDHDHVGENWAGTGTNVLRLENTESSGTTRGLLAVSNSPDGQGIYGVNTTTETTSPGEAAMGVSGVSHAPHGNGIFGTATHETGPNFGLRGESHSSQGTGLYGIARADSGGTIGVRGASMSPDGRGLIGQNFATSGDAIGVYGMTVSPDGTAIRGVPQDDSGVADGVVGETPSTGDGATGVRGHATASDLVAETTGVEGISDADADNSASPEVIPAGVHGRTTGDGSTHGVRGETDSYNGRGVMGFTTSETYEHDTFTTTGAAVMGVTDLSEDDEGITEAIGVVGNSVAQEGESFGVLGRNESPDGAAVIGNSVHNDGTAVFANGDSYTSGDHTVTGDTEVGGRLDAMDVMTGEVLADTVSVSTDDGSDETAAIYGEATDTSSENFGVVGTTASANSDASGVMGIAKATGGSIYPKGVTGVAEAGIAMHALHNATDGFSVGLFALTHSDSGQAIQANADASSGETSGVYGRSGSPDGHGVRGRGEGSSGPSIGVLGQTESPEGYGIYSEADTRSDGLIEAGDGVVHEQRGEPSTDELADGDVMTYNSDGSDGHSAGDLVYAINDGGSILTQVIAEKSNAS